MEAVELTRTIRAPRETVFEAWTRPEHLSRWACPDHATLESVESDARPGGRFRLAMVGPEGERYTAVGTYREVEAPSRVVYTWEWEEEEHAVGETLVTVEFHAVDGGTEVRLVHSGFPAAEAAEGHREGWTSCLDKLEGLF